VADAVIEAAQGTCCRPSEDSAASFTHPKWPWAQELCQTTPHYDVWRPLTRTGHWLRAVP